MGKPFAALPALLIAALFVTLTVTGPASAQATVDRKPGKTLDKQALELVARSADEIQRELGGADSF